MDDTNIRITQEFIQGVSLHIITTEINRLTETVDTPIGILYLIAYKKWREQRIHDFALYTKEIYSKIRKLRNTMPANFAWQRRLLDGEICKLQEEWKNAFKKESIIY